MGLENNYLDTCGFCSWLIPLNLNLEVFYLALEARACNLGLSAIAWSSYSVAMISISGYMKLIRESFVPLFNMKVHESYFEHPSVYQ